MDFCREYFLFYGLTDLMLFLVLAWRYGSLSLVQDTFRLSLPRVLTWASLHLFTTMSDPKLIFLFPTSADGRSSHFRLRVLANHLVFSSFPWSLSANTCRPPLWPTFFTFSDRPWGTDPYYYHVLTVILLGGLLTQTRRGRGHSYLSSLSRRSRDNCNFKPMYEQ